MEWYIKKGVPLELNHFALRARDSGDWEKETITEDEFRILLTKRIRTVNMARMKADISRFISNSSRLEIWSEKYFLDLMTHLKIKVTK